LLTACAAPSLPPKAAAATPAPAPLAAPEARPGPEVPVVPSAAAPQDASTQASKRELVEIAQRFNDANAITGTARTPVPPQDFRIEDLPTIPVPEPLDAATAPTQFGGDPATELVVDW